MALDFTQIKDQPGSAIFLLHDGSEQDAGAMQRLAQDIASKTQKQIILLSSDETIGHSIIDFYQLKGSHFILIVRDDDQLHHVWSDGEYFDPSQIAYIADQAG
jgi:hypothetical protein